MLFKPCLPLLDVKGKEIMEEVDGKKVALTVGEMLVRVLDVVFKNEAEEKFSEKMIKWTLMEKIQKGLTEIGTVDLSAKEVTLLQDRLALAGWSTTIVGRIATALEEPPPAKEQVPPAKEAVRAPS